MTYRNPIDALNEIARLLKVEDNTSSASSNVTVTNFPSTQPISGNVGITGAVSLPTGASTATLQTSGNTLLSNIDNKLSVNQFIYNKAVAKDSGVEVYIRTTVDTNHSSVLAVDVLDKNYNVIGNNPDDYSIVDEVLITQVIDPDLTTLTNTGDTSRFRDIPLIYSSAVIRIRTTSFEAARLDILSENLIGDNIGVPYERSITEDTANGLFEITLKLNLNQSRNINLVLAENTVVPYDRIYMIASTADVSVDDNIIRAEEIQISIDDFETKYTTHEYLNKNYTEKQLLKSLLSFIGGKDDTTIITELVNINSQLSSGITSLPSGNQNVTVTSSVLPTGSPTLAGQNITNTVLNDLSTNTINGLQKTQLIDSLGNVFDNLQVGGQDTLMVSQSGTNFVLSVANSTTTQLVGSASFVGTIESIFNQQTISVLLTSDKAGTLTLRQYIDVAGTRITNTWVTAITANIPFSKSFTGNGNFFNLTFVNSAGAATTTLNINTAYGTLFPATNLGNVPVSLDEINGAALTIGQKPMSTSIPVVISSDQTVIPTANSLLTPNTDANLLARTTSGNSGTIVDTYANNVSSVINVTAVSGTTPTLDIVLQQSSDNGITWQDIYHVRRISTISTIIVPSMEITGRRRWSWTIAGTTPSFTFGIISSRPKISVSTIRSFFDRTITSTLNSVTNAYDIEGTKSISFLINCNSAVITPAQFQLQITNDISSGWASIGNPLVTNIVGGLFVSNLIETVAKFARIICTTAGGGGQVINYANINSIS